MSDEHALLGIQRRALRERFGAVDIATDYPVALESPDHRVPHGTMQDNSRNPRFNARLIALMAQSHLSLLDLGCSGGGAVRSFIEQGHMAVGIEGSDYSLKALRAEWIAIPDHLFTADITKPFRLFSELRDPFRFGVVTLWEVIEHIAERDLPKLLANIDLHLMPGGAIVLSVSPNQEIIQGTALHLTVQQKPWWDATFRHLGWTNHPDIVAYFGDDLVRWEENAPGSFHYVLTRAGETPALARRFSRLAR